MLTSCAQASKHEESVFYLDKQTFKSGEVVELIYEPPENAAFVSAEIVDPVTNITVEKYKELSVNDENRYVIQRIFNTHYNNYGKSFLRLSFLDDNKSKIKSQIAEVSLDKSLAVKSICASENCESFSGNIIQGVSNKVSLVSKGYAISEYKATVSYKSAETNEDFYYLLSQENFDTPRSQIEFTVTLPDVPDYIQFYTANILIETNMLTEKIDSTILLKVARPIEVINDNTTYEAQIFSPEPMSGCIPGALGTNVTYQDTSVETRQQSVTITTNQSYTVGKGITQSNSASESLGVSRSSSISTSSQISEATTASESETVSNSASDSNNFNFTTTDGENWSWSYNNTDTNTEGSTETNGNSTGVNGSVTVGVSGDASIPLLGKTSGKFETTAGVSANWQNSSSQSESNSSSKSTGYMSSQNNSDSTSYGSQYSMTNSNSLTGAFSFTQSNSFALGETNTDNSSRVWDFSETNSNSISTSESESESYSKTIVTSSTASTTTSNTSYIPPRRFGKWFRQTTRNLKQSKILVYNIDGKVTEIIDINYNTWNFAVGLSISDSCESIESNFPEAKCIILPCQ